MPCAPATSSTAVLSITVTDIDAVSHLILEILFEVVAAFALDERFGDSLNLVIFACTLADTSANNVGAPEHWLVSIAGVSTSDVSRETFTRYWPLPALMLFLFDPCLLLKLPANLLRSLPPHLCGLSPLVRSGIHRQVSTDHH